MDTRSRSYMVALVHNYDDMVVIPIKDMMLMSVCDLDAIGSLPR